MHEAHHAPAPGPAGAPASQEGTAGGASDSRADSNATVAWFDPVSGIAGDMALGSLLDAGADVGFVVGQLQRLGVEGWDLDSERVTRCGLAATRALVDAPEGHHHRRWSDIRELLESSPLIERVRDRALAVFAALAEAEGRVHGVPADDVHFHEVGALDAIVDIVGVCAALESLGIDAVESAPVAVGTGTITAAHGVLPNPPPAVVRLLEGRPIIGIDIDFELTTPTGAAIVTALADTFGPAPAMVITAAGFGAGTRDLPGRPNVTGVLIGVRNTAASVGNASVGAAMSAMHGAAETEELIELLANLDDVTGELLGHALGELLDAGARDAWVVPMVMKKGRPAHTLMALCSPRDLTQVADLVARLTGTLGLRARTVVRTALARSTTTVEVEGHPVTIKSGPYRSKPEWDDVTAAAAALQRSPTEVARAAAALAAQAKPTSATASEFASEI